jgi:predicted RNase H-like nuclease (RuvC/YqgF family)
MLATQTHKPAAPNFGALLSASSELDQLKKENDFLKKENAQLKQQIERLKGSVERSTHNTETLEKIIDERDDDIDTLKKEVDGG